MCQQIHDIAKSIRGMIGVFGPIPDEYEMDTFILNAASDLLEIDVTKLRRITEKYSDLS